MDNLLSLVMQAHSPERNHHRQYQVRVGKDLFDQWTARITYGRVGTRGKECCFVSREPNELIRIIRQKLLARLSAPRRIGCSYVVTAIEECAEAPMTTWIPDLVLEVDRRLKSI
jgi:predicted DNA-binding WGR domain protein